MLRNGRKRILKGIIREGAGQLQLRPERVQRLGQPVGLLVDTWSQAMM